VFLFYWIVEDFFFAALKAFIRWPADWSCSRKFVRQNYADGLCQTH